MEIDEKFTKQLHNSGYLVFRQSTLAGKSTNPGWKEEGKANDVNNGC